MPRRACLGAREHISRHSGRPTGRPHIKHNGYFAGRSVCHGWRPFWVPRPAPVCVPAPVYVAAPRVYSPSIVAVEPMDSERFRIQNLIGSILFAITGVALAALGIAFINPILFGVGAGLTAVSACGIVYFSKQ